MKNISKYIFLFILYCLVTSCNEDSEYVNSYFEEVYPEILEAIDIDCVKGFSENYVSANINNHEFCHFEDLVGEFRFRSSNKFTTETPVINTGNMPSDSRRGLSLILGDHLRQRSEYFKIHFPDFEHDRNVYEYLDSMFSIEWHEVIGDEDIVIPAGTSIIQEQLLRVSGGYLNKFHIQLNSIDKRTETGGHVFSIGSIFGNQEGSYLRFNNVEKNDSPDGVIYNMEIEFQCKLYHQKQYGYEGLWGYVRNGKILANVKVEE